MRARAKGLQGKAYRVRVRVEFRVRARFAEPLPSFAQSQVLEHDVNSRLLVRVRVRVRVSAAAEP